MLSCANLFVECSITSRSKLERTNEFTNSVRKKTNLLMWKLYK